MHRTPRPDRDRQCGRGRLTGRREEDLRPRAPLALAAALLRARPVRFLAVGALNTLFSFLVFEGLLAVFGHAPLCLAVSYVLGALFNFVSTGRLVFGDHHAPSLARFLSGYALVLAVNLALQEALARAGVGAGWGQLVLLPFVAALSYGVNRRFIFVRRR